MRLEGAAHLLRTDEWPPDSSYSPVPQHAFSLSATRPRTLGPARIAFIRHTGPYASLPQAYPVAFQQAIQFQGYEVVGLPAVEIYHAKSLDPSRSIQYTDIYLPLQRVRQMIKQAASEAREFMKYGHPHYDLNGSLFALASQKHYMALYVTESNLVEDYRPRLGKTDIGKNCLRFRKLEDLPLEAVGSLLREARSQRLQRTSSDILIPQWGN